MKRDDPLIPPTPSEEDYLKRPLQPHEDIPATADPIALFRVWLAEADKAEPSDPNAMALATVDEDGLPDVRMVLLKEVDQAGFAFYTNLDSAKGQELAAQPKAALLFHWKSLRRQVRVRGAVEKVSEEEADAYFATRARHSQIGAWASDQSRPMEDASCSRSGWPRFGLKFGSAPCRARLTGPASASCRKISSSGAIGRGACPSAGAMSAPATAGPCKPCSRERGGPARSGSRRGHGFFQAKADRTIETHIAAVFLIGARAYKLKKAVDLGFLDFSTRAKRMWAIRRELEFNRSTAPDIYLEVAEVARRPDGQLAMGEPGEPLESLLVMRRFDPEAVLSNAPDRVQGDFAEALGRQVAVLHAGAEVRPGGAASLAYVIDSNAEHLRRLAPVLGAEPVKALLAATDAEFERRKTLLDARGAADESALPWRPAPRQHPGGGGRNDPFDCIEFNDTLSEIDVLYDFAFLLMDLSFRGQGGGANRVLNGYLDEAAHWLQGGRCWRAWPPCRSSCPCARACART